NLRFQLATGHLEDSTKVRQIRKQIARLQTILRERELIAGGQVQ
ncbi:MAG: 50S ribosomal protein L29, partial [Firmicutes bacterium]|nr:50S ribosomal protein L29 [Bacillota bacterium]